MAKAKTKAAPKAKSARKAKSAPKVQVAAETAPVTTSPKYVRYVKGDKHYAVMSQVGDKVVLQRLTQDGNPDPTTGPFDTDDGRLKANGYTRQEFTAEQLAALYKRPVNGTPPSPENAPPPAEKPSRKAKAKAETPPTPTPSVPVALRAELTKAISLEGIMWPAGTKGYLFQIGTQTLFMREQLDWFLEVKPNEVRVIA